jgi:excisionase family DNA binding protein
MIHSDRLTINQAAEILGISSGSLRLLIQKRAIRHLRLGPNRGRYWFIREWLDEYLESCIEAPDAPADATEAEPLRILTTPTKPRKARYRPATVEPTSFKDDLRTLKAKLAKRGGA